MITQMIYRGYDVKGLDEPDEAGNWYVISLGGQEICRVHTEEQAYFKIDLYRRPKGATG